MSELERREQIRRDLYVWVGGALSVASLFAFGFLLYG